MTFFAPGACAQVGTHQKARHSTHHGSRAATPSIRIRRGLISGLTRGGWGETTSTVAKALRFPSLDGNADLAWQRQFACGSVQELHADWLSILAITDDHPPWLLNGFHWGIVPKRQHQDIRIWVIAYFHATCPSGPCLFYSSSIRSRFCHLPQR